jgi:hypothetical protein
VAPSICDSNFFQEVFEGPPAARHERMLVGCVTDRLPACGQFTLPQADATNNRAMPCSCDKVGPALPSRTEDLTDDQHRSCGLTFAEHGFASRSAKVGSSYKSAPLF